MFVVITLRWLRRSLIEFLSHMKSFRVAMERAAEMSGSRLSILARIYGTLIDDTPPNAEVMERPCVLVVVVART